MFVEEIQPASSGQRASVSNLGTSENLGTGPYTSGSCRGLRNSNFRKLLQFELWMWRKLILDSKQRPWIRFNWVWVESCRFVWELLTWTLCYPAGSEIRHTTSHSRWTRGQARCTVSVLIDRAVHAKLICIFQHYVLFIQLVNTHRNAEP